MCLLTLPSLYVQRGTVTLLSRPDGSVAVIMQNIYLTADAQVVLSKGG